MMRAHLIGGAVGSLTLLAAVLLSQTTSYGDVSCSTSKNTFKVPGRFTAFCANGHCTFSPAQFVFSQHATKCPNPPRFSEAAIYIGGWDWELVRTDNDPPSPIALWRYTIDGSWNATTQTFTPAVTTFADHHPNQFLDGYNVTIDFEIIGTTRTVSMLHRFPASCNATGTSCSATASTPINTGWYYAGQALSQISFSANAGLNPAELKADVSSWNGSTPTTIQTAFNCTLNDPSLPNVSLICDDRVVGLSGTSTEIGSWQSSFNPLTNQTFPVSNSFSVDPGPVYPHYYHCGLMLFDLRFSSLGGHPIWSMSAGSTPVDCNITNGTLWTGNWREFLGDRMNSYHHGLPNFNAYQGAVTLFAGRPY